MDFTTIKQTAEQLYQSLQPYCVAIYLGGSLCEGIIERPHDVDFICFSTTARQMNDVRKGIYLYTNQHRLPDNYDFVQIRNKQNEERAYGSYINKTMIKLVGEDIIFGFDVIEKDREEYLQLLKTAAVDLSTGKIQNQKRWYQVLRGTYILINNSYKISEEQKKEINILHDLTEGWEQYRDKTLQLLNELSQINI